YRLAGGVDGPELRLGDGNGNTNRKGRPAAQDALNSDIAAEHTTEMAAQRQAKAGATILTGCRWVSLSKFNEEPAKLLGRDADARVRHADTYPFSCDADLSGGAQDNMSIFGEFTGVAQEIQQDLADLGRIGVDHTEIVVDMDFDAIIVSFDQRAGSIDHLPQ